MNWLQKLLTLARFFLNPASLGKYQDWKRTIKYPSERLMLAGIAIVDPFQGPMQERMWLDGRGRYT